jgi:hypothetical protein
MQPHAPDQVWVRNNFHFSFSMTEGQFSLREYIEPVVGDMREKAESQFNGFASASRASVKKGD